MNGYTRPQPANDAVNKATYAAPDVVRTYARADGCTDPGESAALEYVANESRGGALLDIGVGGGRTIPLLRAISRDYLGVDYTPSLLAACRQRYPDVRLRWADARQLTDLPSNHFKLVVFSYNGIDSVGHDDRQLVMRAVHRVLGPNGVFLFSSHNREGPVNRQVHGFEWPEVSLTRNPLRLAVRMAYAARAALVRYRAERRHRRLESWSQDYCLAFVPAHDHGLMIYHATRSLTVNQLRAAGFDPSPRIISNIDGRVLSLTEPTPEVGWFHYIARKPPAHKSGTGV